MRERLLKASKQGLEIVDRARISKGWNRQQTIWWERSHVALATLKRFWQQAPIKESCFSSICEAVGVDWERVVERGDSSPYVYRPPSEDLCGEKIVQLGALIRIQAPQQMGKTLLMHKIINKLDAGYRKVYLNLRYESENTDFDSLDNLLQCFCTNVAVKLDLTHSVEQHWKEQIGNPKIKCSRYFQKYVLAVESPLVLALDQVDSIYPYPEIAGEFLGMLRFWHESAKSDAIAQRLRLILSYREEYTITDINSSPFNVGTHIKLEEFSQQQVQDFARQLGGDLESATVTRLMEMVGGHPYLVKQALWHLTTYPDTTVEQLLATAPTDAGIYAEHLQGLWMKLKRQPEVDTAFKQIISTTSPVALEQTSKLYSMGLVKHPGNGVLPRCELYRQYFRDRLGVN